MPNGSTHDQIAFVMSPIVFGALLVGSGSLGTSALVAISFVGHSLFLSPDLDIKSSPLRRWLLDIVCDTLDRLD